MSCTCISKYVYNHENSLWLKCLIMIIEGDPGVVPVGDLDPGGLVLESLSEQLTWNKVSTQQTKIS